MRKIANSYLHTFRPVSIDRRAFKGILDTVTNNSESVKVILFDREYEYSSLAEVDEAPEAEIIKISIETRRPYSTLTLGKTPFDKFFFRDDNRLYAEAGEAGEAIFLKIRDSVTKRQRTFAPLFTWGVFALSVAFNLSTAYGPWRSFLNAHFGRHSEAILSAITNLYQMVFLYFTFRGISVIRLREHARGSFLARNKDDLWKLGVAALAGAIFTELIHALVTRFTH